MNTNIYIDQLKVYAFHGALPQERTVGGEYLVSIRVEYPFQTAMETDQLEHTLDYGQLCQLIREEMDIASNLLEHVAGRIAKRLLDEFPQTQGFHLHITKCNPPMGADCQGAGVELEWKRQTSKTNQQK